MFTIANTVPNSMYILLAGGVLNTVLVPQIVRAIKHDADGGEAYTNRIMTAGLLVLGAHHRRADRWPSPLVIWLYSAGGWRAPGVCGAVRLDGGAGLLLHAADLLLRRARAGRPGAQRPRPVRADDVGADRQQRGLDRRPRPLPGRLRPRRHRRSPFTTGEELLLGLGSTLGIVAQAAVLVPFLRGAGYRFRPALRLPGHRAGQDRAGWPSGPSASSWSPSWRWSWSPGWPRGATAGGAGGGLTAYYNAYASGSCRTR